MSSTVPLFIVDAFADAPFTGNPAAVCLLPTPRDAAWMQRVAAEMNLSETAFVSPGADGELALRWFTPAVEVDLCGHATLASANVLWETARLSRAQPARFRTKSGLLVATLGETGITLDFPALACEPSPTPEGLESALGARPLWVGRSRSHVLALVESEAVVRALAPDMPSLAKVDGRAFIATAVASTSPFDFVSRFFAPRVGVPEDPVTGSAHCVLAPFWGARLGKGDLVGYQASSRGGIVRVGVNGDRVTLGGKAVTMVRGELLV